MPRLHVVRDHVVGGHVVGGHVVGMDFFFCILQHFSYMFLTSCIDRL